MSRASSGKIRERAILAYSSILLTIGFLFFHSIPAYSAQASMSEEKFDHNSTLFPLLGGHRGLACTECHSGGKYRGTPRLCTSCHNNQKSYGMPAGHVPTKQKCDLCHSAFGWTPVKFVHDSDILSRPCSFCHVQGNMMGAVAKPNNHVATILDCGNCHSTASFSGFNHANIGTQLCSSCHKSGGTGMPPRVDSVHGNLNGQDCASCHSTTSFASWRMNHSGISPPTTCATCHIAGNNVGAVYTPNPHPYAASNSDCSQCHTGFSTFAGAVFNHSGVTSCKTCHYPANPAGAMPPPATAGDYIHNPVSNILSDCNSCHSSTNPGGFASFTMVHSAVMNYATTCQNCHRAGNPMGAVYEPNHNVGIVCGNCHSTSTFNK